MQEIACSFKSLNTTIKDTVNALDASFKPLTVVLVSDAPLALTATYRYWIRQAYEHVSSLSGTTERL